MLEHLIQLDQQALLSINGLKNNFLDPIMWFLSNAWYWGLSILFIIFYALKTKYTISGVIQWKSFLLFLGGLILVFALGDQISASLIKPFFERFRPSHEPSLDGLVQLYLKSNGDYYHGGKYGFVSSHAANSMAAAMYVTLSLKSKVANWVIWSFAILTSFSRMYLGVHYPGDIIGGALVGFFCGWVAYKVYQFFLPRCLSF